MDGDREATSFPMLHICVQHANASVYDGGPCTGIHLFLRNGSRPVRPCGHDHVMGAVID